MSRERSQVQRAGVQLPGVAIFFVPMESSELQYRHTRFHYVNKEEDGRVSKFMQETFDSSGSEKQFVSKLLPQHGTSWQNLERGIKSQEEFICAFGVRISNRKEPRECLFDFVSEHFPCCELVAYIDHGFVNALLCGSECDPRKVKKTLTDNFQSSIQVDRKTSALRDDLPHILRRHFYNQHWLIVNSPTGLFRELFGSMYSR